MTADTLSGFYGQSPQHWNLPLFLVDVQSVLKCNYAKTFDFYHELDKLNGKIEIDVYEWHFAKFRFSSTSLCLTLHYFCDISLTSLCFWITQIDLYRDLFLGTINSIVSFDDTHSFGSLYDWVHKICAKFVYNYYYACQSSIPFTHLF